MLGNPYLGRGKPKCNKRGLVVFHREALFCRENRNDPNRNPLVLAATASLASALRLPGAPADGGTVTTPDGDAAAEAMSALTNLGYQPEDGNKKQVA